MTNEYVNPFFDSDKKDAEDAGLEVIAYHFGDDDKETIVWEKSTPGTREKYGCQFIMGAVGPLAELAESYLQCRLLRGHSGPHELPSSNSEVLEVETYPFYDPNKPSDYRTKRRVTQEKIAEAAFEYSERFAPFYHPKYEDWECGECLRQAKTRDKILHSGDCFYNRIQELKKELENGD